MARKKEEGEYRRSNWGREDRKEEDGNAGEGERRGKFERGQGRSGEVQDK